MDMSESPPRPADPDEVIAAAEAVLFAAGRPVSMRNLCSALDEFDPSQVRAALQALSARYDRPGCGIELAEVAGGYVVRTKPSQKRFVIKARQKSPARLSRAAMETLALVAYKQPVTRAEIEAIRGVDSSGTLRFLMERRLVRIQGRKDVPGRPLLYGTTRYFLELFQLKDLKSLPDSTELKELELLSKGQLSLFEGKDEGSKDKASGDTSGEIAKDDAKPPMTDSRPVPPGVDEGPRVNDEAKQTA